MRRAGDVCFSEVFRDGGGKLLLYTIDTHAHVLYLGYSLIFMLLI